MKTFETKIYNQINPIGFDLEILYVQLELKKIPWLEACFGVAIKEKDGTRYFPKGSKNQYGVQGQMVVDQDLTFDDSYASRIFFHKEGSDVNASINKWNWVTNEVDIVQKFSVILHANLSALEVETSEQIKADLLYALNKSPKLIGLTMDEEANEVWKGFTVTEQMLGVTRYPNYCLKVDMTCTYPQFPYNGASGYQPNF